MSNQSTGVTDTPEEVQLRPDGGRLEVESDSEANGGGGVVKGKNGAEKGTTKDPKKKEPASASFTLNEAMKTSSFWILLFNNVLYSSIGPTTTLLLLDIVLDTVGGSQTALKAIDVSQQTLRLYAAKFSL